MAVAGTLRAARRSLGISLLGLRGIDHARSLLRYNQAMSAMTKTSLSDQICAARLAIFRGLLETVVIHSGIVHVKVFREGPMPRVVFLLNG